MTSKLYPIESKRQVFAPCVSSDSEDDLLPVTKKQSSLAVCDDLLNIVHGQPVAVCDGTDLVKTDHAKIQLCVKRLLQSVKEEGTPCLQHLKNERRIGFVEELMTIFISDKWAGPKKERAIYTVHCLAKASPHLEALDYRVQRLRKKSTNEAMFRLTDYMDGLGKPLKLTVPISPYVLPKRLPAYLRSYGGKAEKIVIKNPQTHALFWKVKEIYINTTNPDYNSFETNLCAVGNQENIKVLQLPFECSHQWIRDPLVLKSNGEMLLPADLYNDGDNFRERMQRFVGDDYCVLQGQVARKGLTHELLKSGMPGMRVAPFYFEGGNLLEAFDPEEGEPCFFSGAANLTCSLINAEVTFCGLEEDLLSYMQEREKEKLFSDQEIERMRKKLERALLLLDFSSHKEERWIAKLSLYALEYIKLIMVKTLEANVVFLGDPLESQPAFHLDLGVAPTPEFVAVQSPAACRQLIEDVFSRQGLTDDDKKRLKMYHQENELSFTKQTKKYALYTSQLKEAGFKVVPVAGLFHDDEGDVAINFFNSVIGLGADDKPICITNGSGHPADRYLREAFVYRMKEKGFARVYHVGREEEQEINLPALKYEAARKSLLKSGAVHCRVQTTNALFKEAPKDPPNKKTGFIAAKDPVQVSLPRFFRRMLDLAKEQQ